MTIFKSMRADYYFNKGAVCFDKGKFAEAKKYLTNSINLKPALTEAYYYRGIVNGKLKSYDEAIFDFSKVVISYPELSDAYRLRADAYFAKGETINALAEYNNALNIDPEDKYSIRNRNDIMNSSSKNILPDDNNIFCENRIPWQIIGSNILNKAWLRYEHNTILGAYLIFIISGIRFTGNILNLINQHLVIFIYWIITSLILLLISNSKYKTGFYSKISSWASFDYGLVSIMTGVLHYFFYSAILNSYSSRLVWLVLIIPFVFIYTYAKFISTKKFDLDDEERKNFSYLYVYISGILRYITSDNQERKNYDITYFTIPSVIKGVFFTFIVSFFIFSAAYFFIVKEIDIVTILGLDFRTQQNSSMRMLFYMIMPFLMPLIIGSIYKTSTYKKRSY